MSIRSADRIALAHAGAALALAAMLLLGRAHAQGYPSKFDFGQPATELEIAAVAIAIPADGKGLPPGKGDYLAGKQVYEAACAACHGADLMGVANLPDMPAGAQLRLIGGRGTLTLAEADHDGRKLLALCHDAVRLHPARDALPGARFAHGG